MLSVPIKRALLVHSIDLSILTDSDKWDKETFGESVAVKYVRVENVKKNILNSLGDAQDDRALLFVDTKNSTPNLVYSKKDKVTWNGEDYRIREISEEYGDNEKLHHLEIKLV